jgi:pyruvate/2-oxoglutarate dehydrogenase complex dihydrolipoamide dehydrogenase (E3) component
LLAKVPHQEDWADLVRDASHQLEKAQVTVHLNTEVDADLIRQVAPDVIVFATGSTIHPDVVPERFAAAAGIPLEETPGAAGVTVTDVLTVLRGQVDVGKHAVVVGGDRMGMDLAEWLANRGTKVTVVERSPDIANDVEDARRAFLDMRLQENELITCYTEREVRQVVDGGVVIGKFDAIGPLFTETIPGVDTVVVAERRRGVSGLAWLAREQKLAPEIYEVGDCVEPRSALEAVFEAAIVGRRI